MRTTVTLDDEVELVDVNVLIHARHGCEWISADAAFARFSGLRWGHPLAPADRGAG